VVVVVACTDVDAPNAAELIRRYSTDKTSLVVVEFVVDARVPLAARRSMVAGVARAMRSDGGAPARRVRSVRFVSVSPSRFSRVMTLE